MEKKKLTPHLVLLLALPLAWGLWTLDLGSKMCLDFGSLC